MKIKKILTLLLVVVMAVSIAACSRQEIQEEDDFADIPAFTQEELRAAINFDDAVFITGADEDVVIPSSAPDVDVDLSNSTAFRSYETPDAVWNNAPPASHGSPDFTLFEAVQMSGGNLGILQIPRIDLTVNVYDTPDEIEAMRTGVAHLRETSAWVGNVGLAGHDSGQGDFFRRLYQLQNGDEIRFTTGLGEKTYQVVTNVVVHESNWDMLGRTQDNRITLVTCVQHDGSQRRIVQAVQVA